MQFIKLLFIALVASMLTLGLAGWQSGGNVPDAAQHGKAAIEGETLSAEGGSEWEWPDEDEDEEEDDAGGGGY